MRQGVMISTVEHLLSALAGCQIDNCIVEIDSLEVPILDGSAEPFIEMVERAGMVSLEGPRQYLRVLKRVQVAHGSRRMSVSPASALKISCVIEFPHPLIGRQQREFEMSNGNFVREVASARTFGFLDEFNSLRDLGLIRGGSLDNAVVLTPEGGILNKSGLRYADEFVRHKMLDVIGDLALLGMPLLAHVEAERTGHGVHTALVSRLLRDDSAWEMIDSTEMAAIQNNDTA
jgi:UDP-3-O-[3-hydroxymyristoyl] N-acetylglucosamine deacetylase